MTKKRELTPKELEQQADALLAAADSQEKPEMPPVQIGRAHV